VCVNSSPSTREGVFLTLTYKMKDEVEINCFGGWVKPTIQEITADSSLRLVKHLPRE